MSSDQRAVPPKLVSSLVTEDPELRDIVEEFVGGLDERLTELQQAHEKSDFDMLTILAHRLKGAGGSYGYPDISKLCADMEQQFRTHQATDFTAFINTLTAMVNSARAGLE